MKRQLHRALLVLALVAGCDDKPASAPDDAAPKPDAAETAQPTPAKAAAKAPEPELKPEPPKPKPKLALPGASIKLPTKPVFPKSTAPTRHPTGEWSIAGLREDIDGRVSEGDRGVEVLLRATVQEIYMPPTCPAHGTCPPAKQPHVWVTDSPSDRGKRRSLMVVNYKFQIPAWDTERWKDEPAVVLEVGKTYTFKGKFKRFSDTGFAHDAGLLEFVAVRATSPEGVEGWVYPPGASWHPVEIAREEAANQALVERLRASRAAGR